MHWTKEGLSCRVCFVCWVFGHLIFAVMFYVGGMPDAALIFLAQTIMFVTIGLLNLTERVYIYLFAAYLVVSFVGITYWAEFMVVGST